MPKISQTALSRESIVKYSHRFGVRKATIRFAIPPSTLYRWRSRYDGLPQSLENRSRRPLSNPTMHTAQELDLIFRMSRRHRSLGLVEFWCRLKRRNYQRSLSGLYRVMKLYGLLPAKRSRRKEKYRPKPYEGGAYPGERIQIDVKVVPRACYPGAPKNVRLVQYTAIDECTRLRYLAGYAEHNTYTSAQFLTACIEFFPFAIQEVQTDNGSEFTARVQTGNMSHQTLFERACEQAGIRTRKIRPYTPRHNGRVERSHREDQKSFYSKKKFSSFKDFTIKLEKHLRQSNNREMRPLGYLSPNQFLKAEFKFSHV